MAKLCDDTVLKVKRILRASSKGLRDIFKDFDTDGSGDISNNEFKNAIRSLKLGLTAREVDMLLNAIDESGDGLINWKEFSKRFE